MQPVLETLIYSPAELIAAPSSGNVGATGGEASGLNFSDLLQPPIVESAAESTDEPTLLAAGLLLPATGNTLPVADEQVLATSTEAPVSRAGQLPPQDDPVAPVYADAQIDRTLLADLLGETDRGPTRSRLAAGISRILNGNPDRLVKVRPDIEAGAVRSHPPIEALRPATSMAPPQPPLSSGMATTASYPDSVTHVPLHRGPGRSLMSTVVGAKAGDIGAKLNATDRALPIVKSDLNAGTVSPAAAVRPNFPHVGAADRLPQKSLQDAVGMAPVKPAPSPLDSQRMDASQNSARPAPPLPPAAIAGTYRHNQDRLVAPAVLTEPEFPGPRPADTLSPRPVPVFRDSRDHRQADGFAGNRDVALKAVLATGPDNRAETATRAIQALVSPKLSTETPAAQPLSSPPVSQPIIAAAPVSGINSVPSTPAATTVVAVATPVLDPAWADAIQDRVLMLAGRNIQSAEIRLNPVELGPLQVRISIDDNSVSVAFSAAHAVTREALEMALPRLKEALSENGMSLAEASVSDQGIANQRGDGNRSRAADPGSSDAETAQEGNDLQSVTPRKRAPAGLVDTFA